MHIFQINQPLSWLTPHVVFINLYVSDRKRAYFQRKCVRKNAVIMNRTVKTLQLYLNAAKEKNQLLHSQAIELQQTYKNIFSIDISRCTPNQAANKIMDCVFDYFKKYS